MDKPATLALIETMIDRIVTPTGKVYVGQNYATDELLSDLWEARRLLLIEKEQADMNESNDDDNWADGMMADGMRAYDRSKREP